MSSDLSGKWVGIIQGTNLGGVFAEFLEMGDRIVGTVHFNDRTYGATVYGVADANIDSDQIRLVLVPNPANEMLEVGAVTVLAHMVSPTELVGDWRSSIGTAGTISATKMTIEPTEQEQVQMASFKKKGVKGSKRTKVFISYSHQDTDWLNRLRVHLKPLARGDHALDIWDDTQIKPGERWLDEIKRAIQSAKVALLVVSADFLASDFIANNELPPLLEAAKKDGAVIMSLIVSPSRFTSTESLSQFQAVNDPSSPLLTLTKGEQEKILVRVSEEIETVFRKPASSS